ncbi:MAG: uracil-DNA glycosylase [Alphaproteobacteria bacterium]|nr:uracil-DNA glycosylase [Alphaproteobacteria bacterium]
MCFSNPDNNCTKCARLAEFRCQNRQKFPTYHNAPVPSFGSLNAQLLIVGMAPGLHGANQTGRPFTNDGAGDTLMLALKKFDFATGEYKKKKDDGFELVNARITNTVRCVPPQNKITSEEIKNCMSFLKAEIDAMKNLKVFLAIGKDAHDAVLQALSLKKSDFTFAHGSVHYLPVRNLILVDSYHTSRYNISTKRLTPQMFDNVMKQTKELL